MTITLADLTESKLDGNGVFDKLMTANKAHLEQEFTKNRIKGAEYSTVYLGSLQATMSAALQFLLSKEEQNLKSQLLEQQILLAQVEVQKANVELQQATAQLALLEAGLPKINAEKDLLVQQKANLQDALLTAVIERERLTQQKANMVLEGTVLVAQECKLRAEYDVIILNKDKTTSETALLNQKTLTERAQIIGMGVDADSVIGKQKALYTAQTEGFARDAEQKAAKILIDTWNVRRTTDEGTVADGTNMLNDATIGRGVNKMLTGINA